MTNTFNSNPQKRLHTSSTSGDQLQCLSMNQSMFEKNYLDRCGLNNESEPSTMRHRKE